MPVRRSAGTHAMIRPHLTALLLLATAGDLTAQFFVPDQSLTRRLTRVTWLGHSGEQSIAIDHGQPKWTPEYDAFMAGQLSRHARLGNGPWTTLHSSVDLTIGGTKVPRGRWYLGALRDGKQNWQLTLMAADKLDRAGLGGGATISVPPELTAPMQLTRLEQASELLDIQLASSKEGKPVVTLTISFGKYRLRTEVAADFDTHKNPDAPTFAMSPKDKVVTTASGLQYEQLRSGVGDSPKATDKVRVHYCGWLTNGQQFDSSYLGGEPASFPLELVVPGFREGILLMQPGAIYRLTIPPQLAYGEAGAGGAVPPNATLVFTVTLLGIEK
jgi:FKBP-type peptidyl-prolyl cis-trans isomerase